MCSLLQSCLTLCDPMDSSLTGSTDHGISQAGIQDACLPPGDLPDPGIKLMSPVLQADSFTPEPPGTSDGSPRANDSISLACIMKLKWNSERRGLRECPDWGPLC